MECFGKTARDSPVFGMAVDLPVSFGHVVLTRIDCSPFKILFSNRIPWYEFFEQQNR